tara:strand:- start:422 stop:733 length:312 start_codon:yes stop_codon:yes gene_type:complete
MNVDEYPLVVAFHDALKQELYSKYEQNLPEQKATLGQLRDAAKKNGKFADAIRAQEIIMKADGRFVDKRLNMNVKVDANEAREKNERLMNIVKTKLALKKLKE